MRGYASGDGGRGRGKIPNYVTKPLPEFKFKVPGGTKATACYGEVVKAWRCGALTDFYYGTRSDTDPTLIWLIDGTEYAKTDLPGVLAAVSDACRRAGITSIEFGPMWCGYRSITVRLSNGVSVTESYNGRETVATSTRETIAA